MRFTIKIFTLWIGIAINLGFHLATMPCAFADNKIKIFEDYLFNTKSVIMSFSQADSRGQEAKGALIIYKPHRFRVNYYQPYPLLLLGNKNEVVMYDYSLNQTTRIDSKDNLFNFLLVDTKDWKKNFRIDTIFEEGPNITAKLYNYSTDRTISLILSKSPTSLKHIIVEEPDGNVIEVTIDNIKEVRDFDKDLFYLPNPEVFGKPARLTKKDLEKKYK